jgi:hypothetical protein
MSRQTKRGRRPQPPRPDRQARERLTDERQKELAAARRRATATKAGFVAAVAVLFVGGMSFARNAYAGHTKAPVVPLAAPGRYERIVKKNLLQAGVVAPAQAPPGAASAPS